jgi:hypothetical protein
MFADLVKELLKEWHGCINCQQLINNPSPLWALLVWVSVYNDICITEDNHNTMLLPKDCLPSYRNIEVR